MRRVFTSAGAPSYDYDPYGNPLQATAQVTDYGYAGMIANADSGLNLTTYRPYDPVTGRFLLRDPIGEAGDPQGNLYAYVGGDPVDQTDPEGLATFQVGLTGNLQFGPANLHASGGLVIDTNGNIGVYRTVGVGGGAGANAFGGIEFGESSDNCIRDIGGLFSNLSTGIGGGVAGGVGTFGGLGSHGQAVGGASFSLGVGAGAEVFGGISQTWVSPL